MLLLGVTGGIGSGKSSFTDYLADKAIEVIDADHIARDLVTPNSQALAKIQTQFGDEIISPEGHLNRAKLRQIIFSDPEQKIWLEALLQPLILEQIKLKIAALKAASYAVVSAPLLLETGLDKLLDKTLVIDLPETVQIERALLRDNSSEDEIKAIIESQYTREQRLAKADYVISNQGSLADLYKQADQLHQKLLDD